MSFKDPEKRLEDWIEKLERLQVPAPLAAELHPQEAILPLRNLRRRILEGPVAPPRIAFFGPTGSGKSKLFNSLLGEVLSPAGYKRPCTKEAVYYVHREHAGLAGSFEGKTLLHDRAEWREQVFIDTPDFDGVEAENRRIAERIYLEADVFVFITDIHKYADAATWKYLERLRREKKRCLFVINKVADAEPAIDFRGRLEQSFGAEKISGMYVQIGDHPLGDDALVPPSDAGFRDLQRILQELSGKPGASSGSVLAESFRLDVDRFVDAWNRLEAPLQEFRKGMKRLRSELENCSLQAQEKLAHFLDSQLDPALKEEIYQEMLRRLDRIDLLRYPRKLMALPVTGARKFLGRYIPWLAKGPSRRELAAGEEGLDRNFPAVESLVLDFTDDALQVLKNDPRTLGALDDKTLRALRLDHAELDGLYRAKNQSYRAWVEAEARQTAATVTGEHKLKFILSQLIYNSVVIGVQIKTAGALSLTEVLADGVLSPMVARVVGMAISSERVSAFELAARKKHRDFLGEIFDSARQRLENHLAAMTPDLDWLDAVSADVARLREDREAWVARFQGGGK